MFILQYTENKHMFTKYGNVLIHILHYQYPVQVHLNKLECREQVHLFQ